MSETKDLQGIIDQELPDKKKKTDTGTATVANEQEGPDRLILEAEDEHVYEAICISGDLYRCAENEHIFTVLKNGPLTFYQLMTKYLEVFDRHPIIYYELMKKIPDRRNVSENVAKAWEQVLVRDNLYTKTVLGDNHFSSSQTFLIAVQNNNLGNLTKELCGVELSPDDLGLGPNPDREGFYLDRNSFYWKCHAFVESLKAIIDFGGIVRTEDSKYKIRSEKASDYLNFLYSFSHNSARIPNRNHRRGVVYVY